MPQPLVWTDTRDHALHAMRAGGAAWDAIAQAFGISRWAVIERARAIGAHIPLPRPARPDVPQTQADRLPLPAGHPIAWAVLTEGTLLAGTTYPFPPLGPVDLSEDDAILLSLDLAA